MEISLKNSLTICLDTAVARTVFTATILVVRVIAVTIRLLIPSLPGDPRGCGSSIEEGVVPLLKVSSKPVASHVPPRKRWLLRRSSPSTWTFFANSAHQT